MSESGSKLIFITGTSTGLGRALAEVALQAGHRVVGTARSVEAIEALEALAPGRAFGKQLEMTDFTAIDRVVGEIEREIGAIDVLVNNAGYGHEGMVEESPLDDLRKQFEVNVFGAVAMMKAVLPFMRERRSGHILNITSIGGLMTFPGVAYYHGSKFALEGISEALGQEVRDFGIHVTAVEPGAFRTDWAGRSMMRQARTIADYDGFFGPVRKARAEQEHGHQPGDPHGAARAMLALIAAENPPAHLLLGSDALRFAREYYVRRGQEIDAWSKLSASTDFAGENA
ncbi:oxidoreductase [Pseudomonas sp. NPDC089554]|uniref:oxidoreductase n=1 Tax=Pseudomonas sp. NPDC089554 TaxID=3390653 RepID=UPI003D057718